MMRAASYAVLLVLTAGVWAQDAPPAPAPAVPQVGAADAGAPGGPGGRNGFGAEALKQAMERRQKIFELAGLNKEQQRQLNEMVRPLWELQHDLQLQLQALMTMVENGQTPEADLAAALQNYEQLRDKTAADREAVSRQIVEKFGEKTRLKVLLLAMGVNDNGIRLPGGMGAVIGGGGGLGRGLGGGAPRGRRGGAAPAK